MDPLACNPQDLENIMQPWIRGGANSQLENFNYWADKYHQKCYGFTNPSDKNYQNYKKEELF